MRRHGHPIVGAIVGFFFFLFVGIDLMLFGVIDTYSNLITILPIVGIVVGFLWGWWSPFRRTKARPPRVMEPSTVAAASPSDAEPRSAEDVTPPSP
jgi:hypothetical protein